MSLFPQPRSRLLSTISGQEFQPIATLKETGRLPVILSTRCAAMIESESSPYETRLNILHNSLELVDVYAVPGAGDYKWFNQTLCKVNDSVVRMGAIEGQYHWHKHDKDDEFFYVVDGELLIDLEERTVALKPGQGFVVPKTVLHRTRAPQRTMILMVENAGIIPTGD
jgi:mannose-6-phosphate isomerase-like protein (cupin superfamily)